MKPTFVSGRRNLALTVMVPFDCPNNCPFCESKKEYATNRPSLDGVALTDNKNRTVDYVRTAMRKHGGSLGNSGCVSFTFTNMGVIVIERTVELDEDTIMELALDAGAEDVVTEEDSYEIRTAPSDFSAVRKYFEEKNYEFLEAGIMMIPNDKITLSAEQLVLFNKMLDMFEDNDDVQEVYHNVDLPEEEDED